jgi:hypothetical protein
MESQNIINVIDSSNNICQYNTNNQPIFIMSDYPTILKIVSGGTGTTGQSIISFYNADRTGSNMSGTLTINSPYARITAGPLTFATNEVRSMTINNSYVTSTSIVMAYIGYKSNTTMSFPDPVVTDITNGSFKIFYKNSILSSGTCTIYIWFRVYSTTNYTP